MPRELPASAVAALATHVLEGDSLDDVLRHLCTVAIDIVDGAQSASVTLLTGSKAHTYGATDDVARRADEAQYGEGGGPCIDAARASHVVLVPDLARETRWASASEMLTVGCASVLALPLPVQGESIGGLNLYSTKVDPFDDDGVGLGEEFAAYAAVAVANAVSYTDAAAAAANLRLAMEQRAVIEQAKGIIMGSTHCTADEAFDLLVQQSQHENRKLRDIAREIVERTIRPT